MEGEGQSQIPAVMTVLTGRCGCLLGDGENKMEVDRE